VREPGGDGAPRRARALPPRLLLLGHPVSHSLSPHMHGAALQAAGLRLGYEAMDVAPGALDAVLDALEREGAAGNVTIPHKERVFARCRRRSPLAERVGAVNTFLVDDGVLVGDNTDVGGVAATARLLVGDAPAAQRVALLGAGGSAAAVLAAVERWPGARVRVWSRTASRADALAARFGAVAEAAGTPADALAGATLIVNATPIGLAHDGMPVDPAWLPVGAAVLDLVYRAGETAWVRAARERGHRAADGLPVLVEQGALAFQRWTGVEPDRSVMWQAVGGRPPSLPPAP
jgi:shikimate dehydrogenase